MIYVYVPKENQDYVFTIMKSKMQHLLYVLRYEMMKCFMQVHMLMHHGSIYCLYVIEMLIHGILRSCVMLFTKLYSLQISKRFQVVNPGGHKSQALRIDVLRPTGLCYVCLVYWAGPFSLY